MFKLLNDLVLSGRLQFKEGEISLLGTNICLIPPDVYIRLLKELEVKKKQDILYKSSFESAKGWFKTLSQTTNKINKEELIGLLVTILNMLAIGEVQFLSDKSSFENDFFVFSLSNSLIAELYGRSDHSVDLQFCGYLAGAFSFILGKPMQCYEENCLAVGDPFCLFKVVPEVMKNV